MKTIIAFLMMVAVSTGVFAQGEAISKFFNKYATDESFTTATISSKMFSLITNMDVQSEEDKEMVAAISKLKGLKVLGKENTSDARSLYKEAFALVGRRKVPSPWPLAARPKRRRLIQVRAQATWRRQPAAASRSETGMAFHDLRACLDRLEAGGLRRNRC